MRRRAVSLPLAQCESPVRKRAVWATRLASFGEGDEYLMSCVVRRLSAFIRSRVNQPLAQCESRPFGRRSSVIAKVKVRVRRAAVRGNECRGQFCIHLLPRQPAPGPVRRPAAWATQHRDCDCEGEGEGEGLVSCVMRRPKAEGQMPRPILHPFTTASICPWPSVKAGRLGDAGVNESRIGAEVINQPFEQQYP